ncbi:MAG TPA: hypothetical protein VFH46_02115 [Pyrinomonadaceae bacterium]|nr:hypothetical protein [Pyrinomonadaceae bacterium]
MKRVLFSRSLLLAFCLMMSCVLVWGQSRNNSLLTNASIVKLVKAGFKEKSVITIIAARPVQFDLSTDRIIELKRTGVSEKIILAMMARQEGTEFTDDTLGDEEFFNQSTSLAKDPARAGNSNDGSTVDIFGSSGGSKGSTKTRAGNGASSGDTVTTGSATVKILRPPTEAGGASSKLEKTKSLTNDSICELVEAGFSEGTIIRRIEQSPVEFDLSAAKVEELRKRRVSEKILTAMKAAMGDEPSK